MLNIHLYPPYGYLYFQNLASCLLLNYPTYSQESDKLGFEAYRYLVSFLEWRI